MLKEALQVGGVLDKVKALHIGTHSPAIEAQIFGMLCKARWHLVALHLQSSSYLMMRFRSRQFIGGDGIQVCLNPPRVHIRSELVAGRQLMTYAHGCCRMLTDAVVC